MSFQDCHEEKIHIPGRIQDFGYLIVLDKRKKTIKYYSENIISLFKIGEDESLLNADIEIFYDLFSPILNSKIFYSYILKLEDGFKNIEKIKIFGVNYYLVLYTYQDLLFLELEKCVENITSKKNFIHFGEIIEINKSIDIWENLVKNIANLIDFDRVMVYQFLEDESGKVIAEFKNEKLESFLGLHYPENDIPRQARALYLINKKRILSNANSNPVNVVGVSHELDLTFSNIRAMSPIHCEYVRNSGVSTSFSISIIVNNKLWGLVTCHNTVHKHIDLGIRRKAEILTILAANSYMNFIFENQIKEQKRAEEKISVISEIVEKNSLSYLFENHIETLKNIIDSDGLVIYHKNQIYTYGEMPSLAVIQNIKSWTDTHLTESVFVSNDFLRTNGVELSLDNSSAGILVSNFNQCEKNKMVWFRKEFSQEINWAGNPQKNHFIDQDNITKVSPRKSFELFKETSKGTSIFWTNDEVEMIKKLTRKFVNLSAENELLKTIRENNKNMNDFLSNLESIMDNDTLKNNEMLKLEIQKIKNLMNEH